MGEMMKELNWGGLGSSYAASKLITRREPFSLVITGKAADALKTVAGPGEGKRRQFRGADDPTRSRKRGRSPRTGGGPWRRRSWSGYLPGW